LHCRSKASPGRAASSHGGPMTRPPSERTRLIRSATRRPHEGRRPVNPPVERASTLLNPRTAAMIDPALGPVYGLEGLTLHHLRRAAVVELECAAKAGFSPSGLSAVTIPLLALTGSGVEIAATGAVYGPTREFLEGFLAQRGVKVRYHPP